ncbi:MAG: hypothetical protein PHW63_05055 [Alphaproteobacteria bacterium]|nr:hypothetical protein [Alphaproteobacteria bacterium]
MSIKKYVIRAISAFAVVATLTACNGAPKPDEKERDDIFGPFFDNGTPRDAVGRHLPFGPDGCKGAIHVTE